MAELIDSFLFVPSGTYFGETFNVSGEIYNEFRDHRRDVVPLVFVVLHTLVLQRVDIFKFKLQLLKEIILALPLVQSRVEFRR